MQKWVAHPLGLVPVETVGEMNNITYILIDDPSLLAMDVF